jgi:hypothetical protein
VLTWCVRAIYVTEFALKTLIGDMILLGWRHLASVLIVMGVDVIKKGWKRWTKLKAQTTAVAQIVNASQLFARVGLI